jgi:hypothetical protein
MMDFNEKPKPKGHFDALFSGISLSLSLSHTHTWISIVYQKHKPPYYHLLSMSAHKEIYGI